MLFNKRNHIMVRVAMVVVTVVLQRVAFQVQ
jgi:hypothetical protein